MVTRSDDTGENAETHGNGLEKSYQLACHLAVSGQLGRAKRILQELESRVSETQMRAQIQNDLGVISHLLGDRDQANARFQSAFAIDANCELVRTNLAFLEHACRKAGTSAPGEHRKNHSSHERARIAIISLLFNWPSSGGGIAHTVGMAKALAASGYEVRLLYARNPSWGVGNVESDLAIESIPLDFDKSTGYADTIRSRFAQALDEWNPSSVIVCDSWNFKPHLAKAARKYPYFMRFNAQECLCPLNNCRVLFESQSEFLQCPHHQLAAPDVCRQCVERMGNHSGVLHRLERELSGVNDPSYVIMLRETLMEAKAVLVNNPTIAETLSPYAREIHVIPPGVDLARFPREAVFYRPDRPIRPARVFMSGVIEEPFKGFAVLHEACRVLWGKRRDFELVITAQQPGRIDEFTQSIGWLSQDAVVRAYFESDICVAPSLVQDAFPTVTLEAMACGRSVIASRIGGFLFQILEGRTGLMFKPGCISELAERIAYLLDHPEERCEIGRAGRARVEEHFSWKVIVDHHYRGLLETTEMTGCSL